MSLTIQHRQLVRSESSPRLGYIERYYEAHRLVKKSTFVRRGKKVEGFRARGKFIARAAVRGVEEAHLRAKIRNIGTLSSEEQDHVVRHLMDRLMREE